MLENLYKWLSQSDFDSSVLWLHGPAGAGKSAIAQSFCQKLEAEDRLGASFFFKRGHPSRGNAKKLFQTVRQAPEVIKGTRTSRDNIFKREQGQK
jgi:replication-associated recombination protein RarA